MHSRIDCTRIIDSAGNLKKEVIRNEDIWKFYMKQHKELKKIFTVQLYVIKHVTIVHVYIYVDDKSTRKQKNRHNKTDKRVTVALYCNEISHMSGSYIFLMRLMCFITWNSFWLCIKIAAHEIIGKSLLTYLVSLAH